MLCKPLITSLTLLLGFVFFAGDAAGALKLHAIFTTHMVIQRDKPIVIWGWADAGNKVSVKFGKETAEATAEGDDGRWEVTFPRLVKKVGRRENTANCSTSCILPCPDFGRT